VDESLRHCNAPPLNHGVRMTPLLLAIILFALGGALLMAELFVPGGVLGALGGLMVLGGVVTCFFVNQWVGVGAMGAMIVLGPLAWAGWARVMQRTRLGGGLVLRPGPGEAADEPCPQPVRVGQRGVTVSALRPGGVCEFGDERVPAVAEHGSIPRGAEVRVVACEGGRATVRPV
jgi:membrane-bound serine protease (ClpP class)